MLLIKNNSNVKKVLKEEKNFMLIFLQEYRQKHTFFYPY